MKKIAIFLEGKCELLFVEALIKTLADINHVHIEKIESSGGIGKRNFTVIQAKPIDSEKTKYYLLLYNCGNDKQVKSDIRDQYENLKKAGHSKIIGIRDVYPDAKLEELDLLRSGLMHGLAHCDLPSVIFCLGVMEFEAWLLAEHTHFRRFDANITLERIADELKINLAEHDFLSINQPSKILYDIYWLENIPYDKSQATMSKIFSAINFDSMKKQVSQKFIDLKNLYSELANFFDIELNDDK